MFKKLGGSHAISADEGFEVKLLGRDDLIYIEHLPGQECRKLTVYAGMLVGGKVHRSIDVSPRWLQHWDAPNEHELISEQERNQIIKNIVDALQFLGITYYLKK